MKKIILTIIMLFSGLGTTFVSADVNENSYDLTAGGMQTYNVIENGETVDITITQDHPMLKMANKVYTVRKKARNWSVSYKVNVRNNKIKSVSNLKTTVYIGRISKSRLIKISTAKVRWTGTYTHYISSKLNFTTTIKNGKLIVS